ncbi:unnamed protein product [Pleuronectes platessa]|uniref:Glycine N-acyltransferase-like protein n=1 Tax=Pleuronectes platessa TaxID=8262 RepID=A0A9N7VIX6_PLEPL|nr:glycine N-acyltransferase-like protein 3 isoform X2 [Pleuronectes platessa]CAB1453682.1 unnamed protein product [Pleuronectes platessa]
MELTGEQLKDAETQLRRHLPRSLLSQLRPCPGVGGHMATLHCDCLQTNACAAISHRHLETFNAVASEKHVSSKKLAVCHMMILEDISKLPSVDSSGMSLGSLDESHVCCVSQTWKFANDDEAVGMIRNMITNFPSCCVLDAQRRPVSWILTYASCAMGMLHTLPEHRGKGYAKVLISTMAKRLHTQEYPVYCFIEEENLVSYRLFKTMGFTEDPTYRQAWVAFNEQLSGW